MVECDGGAFDRIMGVNIKAPFELAKFLYSGMKNRDGGSVINISSIGGVSPEPNPAGIYSVSKAALISLTQVVAKEWGKDNIRVNAICPVLIQIKFSQSLWQNEQILKHFLKATPLGRMGKPDEIGALALWPPTSLPTAQEACSWPTAASRFNRGV